MAQPVPDEPIPAQALANVEGCTVDVDGQPLLGHREVGNRDGRLAGAGCDRHLLLRMEAVRLEQPQEGQFQRRADTSGVGFQPGTRIVDVSRLAGPMPWRGPSSSRTRIMRIARRTGTRW